MKESMLNQRAFLAPPQIEQNVKKWRSRWGEKFCHRNPPKNIHRGRGRRIEEGAFLLQASPSNLGVITPRVHRYAITWRGR